MTQEKGAVTLSGLITGTLDRHEHDKKFYLAWQRFLLDPHMEGVRRLFETPVRGALTEVDPEYGEGEWGVAAGGTLWQRVRRHLHGPDDLTIGTLELRSDRITKVAQHDALVPCWIAWQTGRGTFGTIFVTLNSGDGWEYIELSSNARVLADEGHRMWILERDATGCGGTVRCWSAGMLDDVVLREVVPVAERGWVFPGAVFTAGIDTGGQDKFHSVYGRGTFVVPGAVLRVYDDVTDGVAPRYIIIAECEKGTSVRVTELSEDIICIAHPKGTVISRPVWWRGEVWYSITFGSRHNDFRTQLMRGMTAVGEVRCNVATLDLFVTAVDQLVMLTGTPLVMGDRRTVWFVTPDGQIEHGCSDVADDSLEAWPFGRTHGAGIHRFFCESDITGLEYFDAHPAQALVGRGEYVVYTYGKETRQLAVVKRSGEVVCVLNAGSLDGRFLIDKLVVHENAAYCPFRSGDWELVIGPCGPCGLPHQEIGKLHVFEQSLRWFAATNNQVVHVRWPLTT